MSDSLWPHGLQHDRQASLSFTVSWSLLKLMSIELVMPSNHLILCHLLLLPSIFPSHQASTLLIRWLKYQGGSQILDTFWVYIHEYFWMGCMWNMRKKKGLKMTSRLKCHLVSTWRGVPYEWNEEPAEDRDEFSKLKVITK